MRTFSIYLLIAFLAMSVQATLFTGIKPDFVLILVFFYSLTYGQIKGITYGAFAGLLIDSAGGFIIGPNILTKALAGFLASSIRQKFFQWNAVINTAVIAVVSFVDILLIYVCLETFTNISFANRSLKISIMQIVYTGVVGLIIYPLLKPKEDK